MSRRNARKAQNAASLIRPSNITKFCDNCGRYAIACYDLEGNYVTDLCEEHRAKHGYCLKCGNELTSDEKRNKPAWCEACLKISELQREREERRQEIRRMSRWW